MDDIILVDGVRHLAEKEKNEHPWVIVRTAEAGVFFGELEEINGNSVVLNYSRGFLSGQEGGMSEVAVNGAKNPSDIKLRTAVKKRIIFGVMDIMSVTEKAKKSLQAFPDCLE